MHDVQRLISTGLRDIHNWIIDGSKVNLVSVIFNSIRTINFSKFQTNLVPKLFVPFFWPQKSMKTLHLINKIKAWNVINH